MKKVFLTVVTTILFSTVWISCTPETLTNEDETEFTMVDPADDGQVDEEDHRETGD